MYVTEIELQNFKTIENFKGEFSGGVYLVTGENEIGKSTLINAIGTLLTGNRTDNLLKQGEEKGFAKMTVGEGDNAYEVELRFTEKNPRGTITVSKKGSGLKSDRITALQSIFQYQDFDAHEFVKWSETAEGRRKQVEIVKSLLPKEVQDRIIEIDAEVLKIKEERKDVNAEIKAYTSLLDKSGVTPEMEKTYKEEMSLQELLEEKQKASALNTKISGVKERYDEREQEIKKEGENGVSKGAAIQEDIDATEKEIERLKEKLTNLKNDKKDVLKASADKLTELNNQQSEAQKWIKDNQPIDTTEIDDKIEKLEDHNGKVKKVKQHEENKKTLLSASNKKAKMEEEIERLLNERQNIIDKSELPIEGLDFSDDGLTLNGVPFKNGEVSTSQEMEVAAKLIIAKNPTVKVFRIAQGESLGTNRFNAIVDFANKNGYQGFIEEVHRGQEELIIEKYQEKE